MNIKNIKNKGVTLIEVLAVIIIGVLLIIGSFTLYDKSVNKNKEGDLISGIHSIQMNVKNSINDNDYSAVSSDYAISIDAIPNSMIVQENLIIHPFGGELFLAGNNLGFIIGVDGLSKEQCISISSKNSISDYIFIGENIASPSINPKINEVVEKCQSNKTLVGFVYTGSITRMMSSPMNGGPVGEVGGGGGSEVDPNLPCGEGGPC